MVLFFENQYPVESLLDSFMMLFSLSPKLILPRHSSILVLSAHVKAQHSSTFHHQTTPISRNNLSLLLEKHLAGRTQLRGLLLLTFLSWYCPETSLFLFWPSILSPQIMESFLCCRFVNMEFLFL